MQLALPDAAPADRFEIDAVDQPAERRAPARFVAVDVVERAAGVEAGLVAEADALRERGRRSAAPRASRPVQAARRERGQRQRQRVGLVSRVAAPVRRREVGPRAARGEALAAGTRAPAPSGCARSLAQRVVEEPGQDVPLLVRGAEAVEERVLRPVVHHPVGAGDQELRRHGDRRASATIALRRVVEPEQDVDGDRARDQRVGVVGGDALRIVREELRLDVAR